MMAGDCLGFPTRADWKRIYNSSPFQGLSSLLTQLESSDLGRKEESEDRLGLLELQRYLHEVKQRLGDCLRSYVLMIYYYEKGIPDKRWYQSPGRDGHTIQYYPDFTDTHFRIKGWFDFYADTFYYKLFSAWDLVGHTMKVAYGLPVKKVYFTTVVEALSKKNKPLYDCLKELQDSPAFSTARTIRNDITHNCLPSVAAFGVCRSDDSKSVSLNVSYTTSDEVVANAQEALLLFAKTIVILLTCARGKSA